MHNVDIVFFFDDDSVVREDYVENALRFVEARPDVIGLSGRVLRDGVRTGPISESEAARCSMNPGRTG